MTDTFPTPPAPGEPLRRQHFAYPLPDERIAQQGLPQRSSAKLLHYDGSQIHDRLFRDLSDVLPAKSLVVVNATKVFPSRLLGKRRTGGKVELFLLNPAPDGAADDQWAMVKPLKKLAVGEVISVDSSDVTATIVAKAEGRARLRLERGGEVLAGAKLMAWLQGSGIVPLPPYIERADQSQRQTDLLRYQTVYAKTFGSVAAPTAGLHFDDEAMAALKAAGHEFVPVTLHVGAGTFLPVKTEDIGGHRMHSEHFNAPKSTLAAIDAARKCGRPIIAVGTTSFRCLEALRRLAGPDAPLEPLGDTWRSTDLFVYEPMREGRFTQHFFNGILTNFHQPESTLLMLMAALLGYDAVMSVYRHALNSQYRFLSYGDSGFYRL